MPGRLIQTECSLLHPDETFQCFVFRHYAKGLRGAVVSGTREAWQGSSMWQNPREHLALQEMAEDKKTSWIQIETDNERTESKQLISSGLWRGYLRSVITSTSYNELPGCARMYLVLAGVLSSSQGGDWSECQFNSPVWQKHICGAPTICRKCQGN